MEWMVLLQQIFELCIVPLLGVITAYIVSYIRAKTAELKRLPFVAGVRPAIIPESKSPAPPLERPVLPVLLT